MAKFINWIECILITILFFGCQNFNKPTANSPGKYNVLFIVVDDLRPTLGAYDNTLVKSPNIDQLAKNGVTFDRAYSQFPVCGPSRSSFLTGIRPTRTRFASNSPLVDQVVPQIPTLPEHFKNNGYYTISDGKIFHDHGNVIDGMEGWSEMPWSSIPAFWVWRKKANQQYNYKGYEHRKEYTNNPGPSHEAAGVPDNAYPSGKLTGKAIYDLRRLKKKSKPFFLAVGYRKPHLPHNAPKKYWDLYNSHKFKLADNYTGFKNIPSVAFSFNSRELRHYRDIPDSGKIKRNTWLKLIHSYYACVSYTDAQVGKLLNELKKLGLRKNTVVVLMGDHGYQLSSHGMWGKRTNFRDAMRAPLIIRTPKGYKNKHVKDLVEFVDIYPTLASLCGLQIPNHIQGKSFAPLTYKSKTNYNPKKAAFSRTSKGETVITKNYIYTEWINGKNQTYAKMLFNLEEDSLETNNLASSPEYQTVVNGLSNRLHKEINNRKRIPYDK